MPRSEVFCTYPKQTAEQTNELSVIYYVMALTMPHSNVGAYVNHNTVYP